MFFSIVKKCAAVVGAVLVCGSAAHAEGDWKFELVPYAWLSGIDADITAGDREAKVDVGFDDLFDATELAGSFLAVTQYQKVVVWTQFDYFKLDSDEIEDSPDVIDIESTTLLGTGAVGWQFNTFGENSTLDVLGGVRYLKLENDLSLATGRTANGETELVDGVVVLRPSVQILSWLRFNPTMSIGAGDSDLTYELQPQLQVAFTDHIVARFGYRRLYYDAKGEKAGFDGAFHGLLVGLGVTF